MRSITTIVVALLLLVTAPDVAAQSLDERLDREAYLEGLADLGLAEVIEVALDRYPLDDPVETARWRIDAERLRRQVTDHASAVRRRPPPSTGLPRR